MDAIKPTIIDVIQVMKNQVENCNYKPNVIIMKMAFKINKLKLSEDEQLKKQLIRIHSLYENKYCAKIKILKMNIGLSGADFVNGFVTMLVTIEMTSIK